MWAECWQGEARCCAGRTARHCPNGARTSERACALRPDRLKSSRMYSVSTAQKNSLPLSAQNQAILEAGRRKRNGVQLEGSARKRQRNAPALLVKRVAVAARIRLLLIALLLLVGGGHRRRAAPLGHATLLFATRNHSTPTGTRQRASEGSAFICFVKYRPQRVKYCVTL